MLEDTEHFNEEDIERIDYALKIRADNPDRRLTVLQRMLEICADPQAQMLYFGPSVLDAECMAFLLRSRRIPAAFVSGSTRDVTRRKVIADFKSGAVKVLCNCEALTTGFDAPRVTHVVIGTADREPGSLRADDRQRPARCTLRRHRPLRDRGPGRQLPVGPADLGLSGIPRIVGARTAHRTEASRCGSI